MKGQNKSHRDEKLGFVCLLVLRFQRALTNIFTRERSHDSRQLPEMKKTWQFRNNNTLILKN